MGVLVFFAQTQSKAQDVSVIGGITADYIARSQIGKIDHTIFPETSFPSSTYELKNSPTQGFSYGGFINVLFKTGWSINFDIAYAKEPGQINFKNKANNWNYVMDFKYNYLNILPAVRLYPFGSSQRCMDMQFPGDFYKGAYVSLGMQFGLPLNREGIKYKSGGPGYLTAFGSDQEQEDQLNLVLKGRTNIGIVPGIGYEFYNPVPFAINIKYHAGISDVVETLPNSYNFVSDKNTTNFFQLGIAVFIGRADRWINRKGF